MAYDLRRTALLNQLERVRSSLNAVERTLLTVQEFPHRLDVGDNIMDHRVAASVRLMEAEQLLFDCLGDFLVETVMWK